MTSTDPATGLPLPETAIQRVLFTSPTVHIYGIPPITSTKGFSASTWTTGGAQQIFTARLRILETSIEGRVKVDIVLEDPNTGDLFAAAPYTSPAVVQQANDSSRFFAVRVVGERGMKATLGIGFEERGEAFDFGIALTDARKVLGLEQNAAANAMRGTSTKVKEETEMKQDFSLKEGETISVQLPGKGRRQPPPATNNGNDSAALFSIAPPPPAGKVHHDEAPTATADGKSAQELGFDDGEFGEFQ
ncbi:Adaptin ear-binding coat-associated protein 2 [Fulvia fulva]|nr:Adaptin ear-binding coat-associated protein 2 [Fulvia fulva]KAK4619054.1 Adaptin ear-binding coat-associated protein 2 [Fulvia fulva]WPV18089.1 Adaptin ear-binding coat-associated protein 2 [Fulvia fulva]WPV33086.1 Adaptin ear-binding coat-associated protein 2 [Fulvia fulva]